MSSKAAVTVFWLGLLCLAGLYPPPAAAENSDEGYDYSMIDQHALNAPEELKSSVESLVDYLIKPARNDRERLRAIFRWITHNIAYDTEGFFAGMNVQEADTQKAQNTGSQTSKDTLQTTPGAQPSETQSTPISGAITPEMVLERGTADCYGYSVLTDAMLSGAIMGGALQQAGAEGQEGVSESKGALGTNIFQVEGFAKGYGYRVGSDFEGANHAWNEVELDGEWYFLDCTWGAGRPNEQNMFIREFEDYYFLTPPEELVYTHLPGNPEQQHLESPVSSQEFIEMAYLWPAYFKYGLEMGNHQESIIQTDSTLYLTLFAPDSILLMADLRKGQQELDQSYVFIQRDTTRFDIHMVCPLTGEYILRLYAKSRGQEGSYKEIMNYLITSSARASQNSGFPIAYEMFGLQQGFVYTPLQGFLSPERPQQFKLRVPQAKRVAVVIGEQWHYLEPNEDLFEGEVTLEPGVVGVYARFPGSMVFEALLEYTVLEN